MNTRIDPSQHLLGQGAQVSRERLWQSLMDLAQLGATAKGGVCRLALTDLDRQARDLFVRWCTEAGCTVSIDAIGNIFARRKGLKLTLLMYPINVFKACCSKILVIWPLCSR
mgnify:CR=1 FL=1